jgi:hypothetical protein
MYGTALLVAVLFGFSPLARATTMWRLTFVAPVYASQYDMEHGGETFIKTLDFVWNPADLVDPCGDPDDHDCATGGPIEFSWTIRSELDGGIIHDVYYGPCPLVVDFWYSPHSCSGDKELDIAGSGWGWPRPALGQISVSPIPEPGTFALLGLGLLGMGVSRRRKA